MNMLTHTPDHSTGATDVPHSDVATWSARPPGFRVRLLPLALTALLSLSATPALACDDWLARAVAVNGAVERHANQGAWQPLQQDQVICPGDSVRVSDNSRASLYLRNNTFLRLQENSVLHFPAPKDNAGFWLDVNEGVAHFISRIIHRFEVNTPYVNAVVEGTEFTVSAAPSSASVTVHEGHVTTRNDSGTLALNAGEQVSASSRNGTLAKLTVPAAKTVEWAIYYPPVLTLDSLAAADAGSRQSLAQPLAMLQQHRPDLALQRIDQSKPLTPELGVARAALLLSVGDIAQFDQTITPLLQGPAAAQAWSLKTVADAARNHPADALKAGQQAVKLGPDIAATHLALSYAQQSALQLPDALASAQRATQVAPDNTLAWLRVSELQLILGNINAAETALAQAEQHPSQVPSVQAQVLNNRGLLHLIHLDTKKARQSFTQAHTLDANDPQTYLGLGLADLREGDLESGRRQLEYAAMMDPLRSVLRSYLGRAYFEEKRDDEARKQWQLAMQLDPNDPTPYFYSGVNKLFANNPIGATADLETAKQLNNERAVYRGETLLQSDAASRSAALARAYKETGYEQGVLLNGWEAIRRDPTSAEGHRLLADHYATDSRFESARASALLQSQLWQPLTAYPLQAQLGESGIAIVEGSGPQRPGFNEYHSLFMQEGAYGLVNGYGGSDGTWGDDVAGSLLAGPMAVSLGQYHFESNGWRENADQVQDIYNGFVQWQITPSTSVQVEARNFKWEKGDLGIALVGNPDENLSDELERRTFRFGMKHSFDAENAIVFSAIRQDVDEKQMQTPQADTEISTTPENEAKTVELQYVRNSARDHWVTGAGEYNNDQTFDLLITQFDFPIYTVNDENEFKHRNVYAYYTRQHSQDLSISVGTSYNRPTEERISRNDATGEMLETRQDIKDDEWSPKFGLTYRLDDQWTVRSAAFKTFSRELSGVPTLEPTQFVGFNQFFDDPPRSDATNIGLAFDAFISANTLFSISHLDRDMDFLSRETDIDVEYQSQEAISEFTLYHAFNQRFAASLQYQYSDFEIEVPEGVDGEVSALKSQSVPIRLHWYVSDRDWLTLGATYYDQRVTAQLVEVIEPADPADPILAISYESTFNNSAWPVDIELGHRLDCRCGDVRVGIKNIDDDDDEIATPNQELLAFYPSRFIYGAVRLTF